MNNFSERVEAIFNGNFISKGKGRYTYSEFIKDVEEDPNEVLHSKYTIDNLLRDTFEGKTKDYFEGLVSKLESKIKENKKEQKQWESASKSPHKGASYKKLADECKDRDKAYNIILTYLKKRVSKFKKFSDE